MFKFFKRSKGSKKNNSKKDSEDILKNHQQQQLPLSTELPPLSPTTTTLPSQQLNSKMYYNRQDNDHIYEPQDNINFISSSQQQQQQQNDRNLFLNKPKTTKKSSSSSSAAQINNNKISTPNENSSYNNNFHNNNLNYNNKYNYLQTNRAPPLTQNEPKINSTKKNLLDENFIKLNSSRNEFVDQGKRFNYNAADINLATKNNPATNNIASSSTSSTNNDSSYNYPSNSKSKTFNLINNNNNKSDYLKNRENLNSINFNNNKNPKNKKIYCSNSAVDDLSLPSTSSSYNSSIKFNDKNIIGSDTKNKKKSVKFFNPIDKSRDFFNNIMAKGLNHRNKNNYNNNNQQQQQQQQQQNQQHDHQQVIMSNLPSDYYPTDSKIYNSKGISSTPIYNTNNQLNDNNYNQINENDINNIGYQIKRSKNSPDIFKKIQKSHNFDINKDQNNHDNDDDDGKNINDQNIFLSKKHKNLQRRGEADGSDTNITTNNHFNEYNLNSANSNNFHTNRYNYNDDDDGRTVKRDWENLNDTSSSSDIFEEHPPVFSKRMPSVDENIGNDIRKPKSILKKSSSYQTSEPPLPPPSLRNQWLNNNNLVTQNLSNEKDHFNNYNNNNNKKYEKNCSFLDQNHHLNNNDAIDKIEKLSELTECDRDSFINNHHNNKKRGIPSSLYMKMGQSQGKTSTEHQQQQRTRSRSISPPPSTSTTPTCPTNIFPSTSIFNSPKAGNSSSPSSSINFYDKPFQPNKFDFDLPPIITEPLSPKSKKESSDDKYENIPLPKITVDDFSKNSSSSSSRINSGTSPTDSESDIFYDFEPTPPPPRSPPRYPNSPSPPTPTTFLEDIVEEDENDDNDDWHFVSNKDIDTSLATGLSRKQSPIYVKDNMGTSDMSSSTSSSSSSTSTTSTKDHRKDQRNHFIDPLDSDLHDSGFISPSNSQSGKVLIINSCDLINDRDDDNNEFTINKLNTKLQQTINPMMITNNIYEHQNYDDNIFSAANHILIDSISLPDVVVESKIAENNEKTIKNNNNYNLNIPEFINGSINRSTNNNNNDINKSHSTGSVHFIPIHVEADEDKIKIEEIKITNDEKLLKNDINNLWSNSTNDDDDYDHHSTKEKRDLINQEATFNAKLEESEKCAYNAQQKANELQSKINDLEIDLSTKSWNIERLEAELQSIYKEDDSVRKRLKFLEKEKETLKQKFNDDEEELNRKYENLEQQYKELEQKYQQLRTLASSLQTQLATAQTDADECRLEKIKLCEEKDGQLKFLQDNLDLARQERQDVEEKWQKEFETLRNQNQNREDNLLTDCEWKLRTMQKNCKDKIDKAEKIRNDTLKRAEALEEIVEAKTIDESRFKNLKAEVRQLRGLTNDQMTSLTLLHQQIEDLRAELEATNDELEQQIEEVRRMKLNCQNELEAKDRETIQKMYNATQELADLWEHKLLTEMTRLTHELETVHVEERLDDMNKLQTEHIEELQVLTTRYTENEQELSEQVAELQEQLKSKCDVAFNTRIHLDRADRDYQIAMSREEEKREIMIEQLQKEFEQEKLDMEENYRVRLVDVKNEFAKELANSTEEIAKRHRQQLEQQWDQLVADKEEALQALESRHRIRIDEQEARIRELNQFYGNLEVQHQRDMKDLKNAYDLDRSSLQTRDINNAQEIDQLHRKCRCLTNLFEEMRMRYERREPRQEDLREIAELRSKCEAQEHDLFILTEKLRDMQIKMEEMSSDSQQQRGKKSLIRKPPPKTIPTNCDVIYEENEEREQSPVEQQIKINNNNDEDEDNVEDGDSSSENEDD